MFRLGSVSKLLSIGSFGFPIVLRELGTRHAFTQRFDPVEAVAPPIRGLLSLIVAVLLAERRCPIPACTPSPAMVQLEGLGPNASGRHTSPLHYPFVSKRRG
jgi:hypothetical protein